MSALSDAGEPNVYDQPISADLRLNCAATCSICIGSPDARDQTLGSRHIGRSGYSANANTGDATQMSGTKKPNQASVRRAISSGPFWLFTTLTERLRWPCGARMMTMTILAARMTAFANHGF